MPPKTSITQRNLKSKCATYLYWKTSFVQNLTFARRCSFYASFHEYIRVCYCHVVYHSPICLSPKYSILRMPDRKYVSKSMWMLKLTHYNEAVNTYSKTMTTFFNLKYQMISVFILKLDLYEKTSYKYTQDKNLVWNQYTLFDSSRFSHSVCGSSPVKTCANKRTLLEEK